MVASFKKKPPIESTDCAIAIIGSGLAALATARALERQGFTNLSVYERDISLQSRRAGYGLTLKYDPNSVLARLGILEAVAAEDCPSRSHYLFDSSGTIRGYFGNAIDTRRGYGQRGNLRVPRQRVREILFDSLSTTKVYWNHKLVNVHAVHSGQATKMRLEFEHGLVTEADWVIGADGIRSSVIDCLLPEAPPPQPMGVRIVLGLSEIEHPLLHERGFYTLSKGHRLFVMPYSAPTALDPNQRRLYMWQLSFADDSTTVRRSPDDILPDALQRCRDWHEPVPSLIRASDRDSLWSSPLFDRNPQELSDLLLARMDRQRQQVDPHHHDRVLLVGDALHAMSCFKGQGANQALMDGLCVAKWLSQLAITGTCQSRIAAVRSCGREMVQRTAPMVAASRVAAQEWHDHAVWSTMHKFAGVENPVLVERLLQTLQERGIGANSVRDLDGAVRDVLQQVRGDNGHSLPQTRVPCTALATWTSAALCAARDGDLALLRQLSWASKDASWLPAARDTHGHGCLHLATKHGHVSVVHWLVTEAGCDMLEENGDNQTALDMTSDPIVKALLERLQQDGTG